MSAFAHVEGIEWHSVVRTSGTTLHDLSDGISSALQFLRDRGIDPRDVGYEALGFEPTMTSLGPGIEIRIRDHALDDEHLSVVFEGTALNRAFTVRYGESLLSHAASIAVPSHDGGELHFGRSGNLAPQRGQPSSWSYVGALDSALKGMILGVAHPGLASARLRRGADADPEDLPVFDPGSRTGFRCVATLVDDRCGEIDLLDGANNVIALGHILR